MQYSMYGTRGAAQNWHEEYSGQLVKIGFTQGTASLCVFHHRERGIRTYVHGNDYVSAGQFEELKWMRTQPESKYIVKTQTFGPGKDHVQHVKILNRIAIWDDTVGIKYEVDPRHVEIIINQLQLEGAKPVSTSGTKEEGRPSEDNEMPLTEKESTNYRASAARCKHLSPDRPDIAFAVEELARAMSQPTRGDLQRLKRIARYPKGNPGLVMQYEWQPMQTTVTIYSDRTTGKSTTGGCIKIGGHCVNGWSKAQTPAALSSGDTELYASLKVSAETLGLLSMLKDLGWQVHGEIWGDANAVLGIIARSGLGKIRHIGAGLFWIQQVAAEQRSKYRKALRTNNSAEHFTEHLEEKINSNHTISSGPRTIGGRLEDAPYLRMISISLDEHLDGDNHGEWEWISYLWGRKGDEAASGDGMIKYGEVNLVSGLRRSTGAVSQVLWGHNQQARGPNGRATAPPSWPQGSTLTFQHNVGMSWALGLRHGLTMHPRGRHLREGMTLRYHGKTPKLAREQQPQLQLHNQCPWQSHYEKASEEWIDYRETWSRTESQNSKELEKKLPKRKNAPGYSFSWYKQHMVPPARRQSDELYRISKCTRRRVQKLTESLQGTEQFGVAEKRKEFTSSTIKGTPKQYNQTTTNPNGQKQDDANFQNASLLCATASA